jgi:hypothetical protein
MVVYFYLSLAQSYHWLPEQIDAMALDMFWDLLIVGSLVNEAENNSSGYIDDIW